MTSDVYILDNENRGQINVFLSLSCRTPNYEECDEMYEDESKIRFVIDPAHPAKTLFLGFWSKYSQPISIKPVYGEFLSSLNKKRDKVGISAQSQLEEYVNKVKPDIFEKAQKRLFNKVGDEERANIIKSIMLKKQQKIYEMSNGKNYIDFNRVRTHNPNNFKVTTLKRKCVQYIVNSSHPGTTQRLGTESQGR